MDQFLVKFTEGDKVTGFCLAKRTDVGVYEVRPIPTIYYWQLMYKLLNELK